MPRIIRVIKIRRVRQVEQVACMGERKSAYRLLAEKRKRDHLENLVVEGKILLKWILKEIRRKDWTDLTQDREKCHDLLNTVMKYRAAQNGKHLLTS